MSDQDQGAKDNSPDGGITMQVDDPGDLTFRPRRDRWSRHRTPRIHTIWWVVAMVAAIAFVLVIRALLDRTAWTAGHSKPQAQISAAPSAGQLDDTAPGFKPARSVPMVYRCVDGKGGVSLQSQPCGPDERTTRAVPAPPEIEPLRAAASAPSRPTRPTFRVDVLSMADYERQQRLAACAGAKAQRERVLAAVGLRRTYDLLQRLDDAVREACKGA